MDKMMEQRLAQANDLREIEKYGESAKEYTECLMDLVETDDPEAMIHCLGGQSLIYKNLLTKNNSPVYHYLAVAFAKEAFEVGDANKDKIDGRTLSIAYSSYGGALLANGELSEALPLYEKSLAVSTAGIPEKGRLKEHVGAIKYMLGDKEKGMALINEGLSDIRTGDMDEYAIRVWETGALNSLAKIYATEGDQDKALNLANESLQIATDHSLSIRRREVENIIKNIENGQTDFFSN